MRKKYIFGGVVIFVALLMLLVASIAWSDQARAMVALAAADLPMVASTLELPGAYTIRTERLLPTTAGRPLESNEDFVEIWSDTNGKVGWIYFEIRADMIRLIGCQAVQREYIPLSGSWVARDAIAKDQVRSSLIDGKEFQ